MGFGPSGSRSAAIGPEFLKIFGDFGEKLCGDACVHRDDAGENARQETAQVTESDRAIDPPRRIRGEEVLSGQIGGQRVEIVTDHLGAGVLASGQPGQAGRMLKVQTMFDALECFLDTPAAMIEIGEFCRRIARRVEQRGHEDAHFPLRRHLADQAHGRYLARALVIGSIPAIGRWQVHHGVVLARSHELGDGGKGGRRVAAHAERDAAMEQGGHQPGARVTAIKDQHVVGAKPVQALEQHLSLADPWAVQNQRVEQLNAGTKQAEQRRFTNTALSLRGEQSQANLRPHRRPELATPASAAVREDAHQPSAAIRH